MVYLFFGTTAEYIKLIPVIRRLKFRKITYKIILSGQTNVNFKSFEDIVGKQQSYHNFESKFKKPSMFGFGIWTAKTLFKAFFWGKKEFKDKKETIFIVQGDTVSALIGSIVAKTNGLTLVHVEAGLRTHKLFEPFPEEISRTLIGYLADINFCPNKSVFKNIKKINARKIDTFFNTSIESLFLALKVKATKNKLPIKGKYFIFIAHRQEHLFFRKNNTRMLMDAVFSNANKKVSCLFLVHDVTRAYLDSTGFWEKIKEMPYVYPIQTLSFIDFAHVLNNSEYIVTDGGGNHTESHFLGKPCLIFRRKSEQKEGVGENIVISKDSVAVINKFMRNYKNYIRKPIKVKMWPSEVIVNNILATNEK